jgi:hypothetical protein
MNKPFPTTPPLDIDTWFAELDRFAEVPFMEDGRCQPPMPESAGVPQLLFPDEQLRDH